MSRIVLTATRREFDRPHEAAERRLRVAHVYAHLDVGGIERSLVDVLPRLDPQRYDVRMICSRRRGELAGELEAVGIPVQVRRCTSRLPVFWSARRLARALHAHRVDLVHAHAEHAAHCATEAARLAGVPLVVATFHTKPGFDARGIDRERMQWAGRSANVYVSEAVRCEHLAMLGARSARALVIRNGVDLRRFAVAPSRERLAGLREELALNGAHPVLLNVARLQRVKAPEDLLRAFSEVRRRIPGAVLIMAGGGRRHGEVRDLVRTLGLEPHVRMPGMRADIEDLYHLADLHVMASHGEGFSLVVLEAMAAGLPQVLTNVGGTPEAVASSGAARLVPPGEPGRLAEAMVGVLRDETERKRMRAAARERAEHFTIAEQVCQTERLYASLAAGRLPKA